MQTPKHNFAGQPYTIVPLAEPGKLAQGRVAEVRCRH